MKRLALVFVTASLLATGTTLVAQRGRPGVAAATYVAKAGAADLYEIESSRIAIERADRSEVRDMARQLIADHTRSSEQVAAAARADGLRPAPARLEQRQRFMIQGLQRARGRTFDRLYLSQQIPAHREALALHRDYARAGRGDDLRRTAAGIVPVVQGHLAHARRLASSR